jgi:WD40 repeat protein
VNSQLLACGGLDTKIQVFTLNRKEDEDKLNKTFELTKHLGLITSCCFLDENYLISASNDSTLILWDTNKEGACVRQFFEHGAEVLCLDVCKENSNLLISGSGDKSIRYWDIRMREACVRVFNDKYPIISIKYMSGR